MARAEQVDCIAAVLSENVGFTRTATNPCAQGWVDIVEYLMLDAGLRDALLTRYAARLQEEAPEPTKSDRYYLELARQILPPADGSFH